MGKRQLSQPGNPIVHSQQEDFAHLSSATGEQRMVAMIIDFVVMGGLGQLVLVLLNRQNPAMDLSRIPQLVGFLYFILSQYLWGYTIGKSVMGLRLVSQQPGEKPTLRAILGRETLGRVLSVLVLGYGYLRVFISKDRLAWHDRLYGLKVVSLKPTPEPSLALAFFSCLKLGGLAVALVLTLNYVYHYTSFPLRSVIDRLELAGFRVEGATGSIRKGFHIQRVSYDTDDMSAEVVGIDLKADGLSLFPENRDAFQVDRVSVAEGKITLKKAAELSPVALIAAMMGPSEEESAVEDAARSEKPDVRRTTRRPARMFLLKLADVGKFTVLLADRQQTIHFDRLHISNLTSDQTKHHYQAERIYIASDFIDLDLGESSLNEGMITMSREAYLAVKPGVWPGQILKSFTVRGKVNRQSSVATSDGKIDILDGKVTAELVKGVVQINTRDWSPAEYFRSVPPLNHLKLQVGYDMSQGPAAPLKAGGSFSLRDRMFILNPSIPGAASYAGANGTFNLQWLGPSFSGKESRNTWFIIDHPLGGTVHDMLAQLYFARPVSQLTAEELAVITADSAYFVSTRGLASTAATSRQPPPPSR